MTYLLGATATKMGVQAVDALDRFIVEDRRGRWFIREDSEGQRRVVCRTGAPGVTVEIAVLDALAVEDLPEAVRERILATEFPVA